MAHEGKKLVTLWAKYLRTPEKSYSAISDNSTVDRLWSYHSWDIEGRNVKKTAESAKKYQNPVFSSSVAQN